MDSRIVEDGHGWQVAGSLDLVLLWEAEENFEK